MKSSCYLYQLIKWRVTTCVVVWIEINLTVSFSYKPGVTTCVVVWIEISRWKTSHSVPRVTTCVVVWIEIKNEVEGAA